LRDTTSALVSDLSAEHAGMLLKELNDELNSMCSSSNPSERLGAVLVIYELADLPLRDAGHQLVRFSNYLR
jgi:hypothetical protein